MDGRTADGFKPGDHPDFGEGPTFLMSTFTAPARWATAGTFQTFDFRQLTERLAEPELWPGGGSIAGAEGLLPAWTFARYRDDARVVLRDEALSMKETAARVVEVHGLIVEYEDEPVIDAERVLAWWPGTAFVAYTTAFNERPLGDKPAGPRWRVLLPFARPVGRDDAIEIGRWARHPRHSAGMIAGGTEEPWRIAAMPAIAEGGYRWTAQAGAPLDPDACLRELASWRVEDVATRAELLLAGHRMSDAIDRFRVRRADPHRHAHLPLPGPPPEPPPVDLTPVPLPAVVELSRASLGSWPGRLVAISGAAGSGRTGLALQAARRAAASGHPVLCVLLRMGTDEAIARLIAQGSRDAIPWALLVGAGDEDALGAALARLQAELPDLVLWAPTADARTLDGLIARVQALADASGGEPPLIIVDEAEGWDPSDGEVGQRALAAALRDACHGTPDRPGASAIVVVGAPQRALSADPRSIAEQLARRTDLPFAADVGAVIALATSDKPRQDGTFDAAAAIASHRDGPDAVVSLRFHPTRGVFEDRPTDQESA